MGIHVNIGEAKTQLSKLIQASLDGHEVFIDKAGEPLVRIVPARGDRSVAEQRTLAFGAWKGLIPDLDWEAPALSEADVQAMLDADDHLSG